MAVNALNGMNLDGEPMTNIRVNESEKSFILHALAVIGVHDTSEDLTLRQIIAHDLFLCNTIDTLDTTFVLTFGRQCTPVFFSRLEKIYGMSKEDAMRIIAQHAAAIKQSIEA